MASTINQDIRTLVNNAGDKIVAICLRDSTETLGGTIKAVTPYIQAGFTHVAIDEYHTTVIANSEIDIPTQDDKDRLLSATFGDIYTEVILGSQNIVVYNVELEEAE